MRTIPHALDTGGGAVRYNSDASSLDRFQAQPKWEMSVIITREETDMMLRKTEQAITAAIKHFNL